MENNNIKKIENSSIQRIEKEKIYNEIFFRFWANQKTLVWISSINLLSLIILLKDRFFSNTKWSFITAIFFIAILFLISINSIDKARIQVRKLERIY